MIILAGLMTSVVLVILALVVDLGYLRTGAQLDQSIADFAALAAGSELGSGDPQAACERAVDYLNTNAPGMAAINPTTFCTQPGNDVGQTVCNPPYSRPQAAPTATSGKYTISVHYPVLDAEIADPIYGSGLNDGIPCGRLRVMVTSSEPVFFGAVLGQHSYGATRSATIEIGTSEANRVPALWLLDPYGCTALGVSGGSQLTIGATSPSVIPGVISVDSDGSTCTGSQTTLSVTGAGTSLQAIPTGSIPPAAINLFALPPSSLTCTAHACDSADVTGGRISPQPVPSRQRATRAPVDWRYNCKASYPTYHGLAISDCPDAATVSPYIDLLKSAIGTSGNPGSYQRWTAAGNSCNAAGTIVVTGNWWVDCPGACPSATASR